MKRFRSIFLAAALILGMTMPASAAGEQSQSLEEAILHVKSIIDIPDSMTVFDYYSNESDYNGKNVITWWLNWWDEDYNEYIDASVDSLGNLLYYSHYNYNDYKISSGLAKVTRAEGRTTAEAFLAKVLPDIAADMQEVNETGNLSSTYGHYYDYQLYRNGFPVPFLRVSISVNKYTGELESYSGLSVGTVIPEFPQPGNTISSGEAKRAYLDGIGLSLKYYSYYDYSTKTLNVFPAYDAGNMYNRAIDAESGEVVDLYNRRNYYSSYATAAESAKGTYDSGLSAIEQAGVDSVAGLISKEEAESILRGAAEGIPADSSLESARLYQNNIEPGKYTWELEFYDAYGSVDAGTGEVLSFSCYYYKDDRIFEGNANLSFEEARKKVESFINKNAPGKLALTRLVEDDSYTTTDYRGQYNFQYIRQANGIDFVNNSIYISISKDSGLITYYYCYWYDSAVFPSIEGAISEDKAFDLFNEAGNLSLSYGLTQPDKAGLVYQFENSIGFYLNPITGERIDYTGGPYRETEARPEYTDLAGHWSEDFVNVLLDNGYYLSGDRFEPNKEITQLEFFKYLYSTSYWLAEDEDYFYQYLDRQGIVTADERAPQAALTRQDAAKFIIRYMGLDKAGIHPEIFKNPFSDTVQAEYLGYAALCRALGIMKGDGSGAFNGAQTMTRAEAASAIFHLLQVT